MLKRLLNSPLDIVADYALLFMGCAFIGSATDSKIGFGCWCICIAMRGKL